MRTIIAVFFSLWLVFQTLPEGACEEKCIDADGEAVIVRGDVPSAKMEAVARAKWSAIEKTVGTEVKAQSFVQNFTLVEDVIKAQAAGVVKSFQVLGQETKSDMLTVRIKACIESTKALEAVSSMALNNSLAVFIPARKPNAVRGRDEYEETNILSETLTGILTDNGYTVVDVAPTHTVDAKEIENAVKSGSTLAVRSMMYKFLSNVIIIGRTEYTISTKKGEDIGYGISMPFNNVTVRLTYRIVAKNNKTGTMEVLTAGTAQGKGMAGNVEDATAEGLKDLAEKFTPLVLDKVAQYIQGNMKKISVKVNGVTDIGTTTEIKGVFQNIVWVAGVEEKGMGQYIVSYPENTLYLANSIKQKGNFRITDFSPYSITADYQK